MKFSETPIAGLTLVDLRRIGDERGFFARQFCQREMANAGLDTEVCQVNVSFNSERGTLRGIHYQAAPHQEGKLVRCLRGAIFDVAVDLRPDSSTYLQWYGVELSAENRNALFVPKGFGHAYQTLTEDAEVFYLVSAFYEPSAGRGLRFDDPKLAIDWPLPPVAVSEQDLNWDLL